MSNTINALQASQASAVSATAVTKKDSDGDSDKSGASAAPKIGPAVLLSLSNTKANDAAQGDPDHDGH
jgi:hypothetical protein